MPSVKQQKILYLSIITILLGIIGYSAYYLLGGFKDRSVVKIGPVKRNIIGKAFEGYYAHPDLERIWNDARELVEKGAITGSLAVVNFQNDSLDNDEVQQFIGIVIDGGMAEIPVGFEVLELKMDQRLMIALSMHPLVRPSPPTIEEMFNSYAEENGSQLGNYTLELHFQDNSMIVESPIVD